MLRVFGLVVGVVVLARGVPGGNGGVAVELDVEAALCCFFVWGVRGVRGVRGPTRPMMPVQCLRVRSSNGLMLEVTLAAAPLAF